MTKLIIASILSAFIVVTPAYANKVIHLDAHESKSLKNSSLWALNVTCNVQAVKPQNQIKISVTENKGQINGKSLTKGQSTSLNVKNNDHISVSADPGASVNIINNGTSSIEAICYC